MGYNLQMDKYMVVLGRQCLGRNFDSLAEARRFQKRFQFDRSGYPTHQTQIVPEPVGIQTGEYPVLTEGVWHRP